MELSSLTCSHWLPTLSAGWDLILTDVFAIVLVCFLLTDSGYEFFFCLSVSHLELMHVCAIVPEKYQLTLQSWHVSSQLHDTTITNCASSAACSSCVHCQLYWCRSQYLHTLCNALLSDNWNPMSMWPLLILSVHSVIEGEGISASCPGSSLRGSSTGLLETLLTRRRWIIRRYADLPQL